MHSITDSLRALLEDLERITEENADMARRLQEMRAHESAAVFRDAADRGRAYVEEISGLLDGD